MLHEKLRGLVKEWAACDFGAAGDANEVSVEQRLHHAIDRDATHGLDVGAGDGLAVGDDGEGFHRRGAQAGLAVLWKKLSQPRREVGLRHQLPTCRTLADLKGPAGLGVFALELFDRVLKLRGLHFREAGDLGIFLGGFGSPFQEI